MKSVLREQNESEVKRRAKESGRKAEEVRPEVIAESLKTIQSSFEHKEQKPRYWMNVEVFNSTNFEYCSPLLLNGL